MSTNAEPAVTPIDSYEEFKKILASGATFVVDFWATWCGPCKMIRPVFDKMAASGTFKDVKFYSVDVDDQSDIATEVGIRVMPTFMVFKDGSKIDEMTGAAPANLNNMLAKYK